MKKRCSFSREFKREAAGMALDQGFSYREVCRQLIWLAVSVGCRIEDLGAWSLSSDQSSGFFVTSTWTEERD